jgi:hypothetical protein
MKICRTCQISKNIEEFRRSSNRCRKCDVIASREYYLKNIEKQKKYQLEYRTVFKEKAKKRNSEWVKNNPAKNSFKNTKRKSAMLRRTPEWLSAEHLIEISHIYQTAAKLTKETGVAHHVDHVVPLQGKLVSGLHVPWNLRAIPAIENIQKHNLFKPA